MRRRTLAAVMAGLVTFLAACETDASGRKRPDADRGTGGGEAGTVTAGKARLYPATNDPAVPFSRDFEVAIGGAPSPVYAAKIGTQHEYRCCDAPPESAPVGFTNFDISGPVTAVVTVKNRAVSSARVYPSSLGVSPVVDGNVVTVPIPKPGKYELQIDGDEFRPLYLFANPAETAVPKRGAPGVMYFGPGVHSIGRVKLGGGRTVYLAPGAIVHGAFTIEGPGTTIRGRGILDGSGFPIHATQMIHVMGDNATLEGITVIDPPTWTINFWHVRDGLADNVKVIAYRQNSDGIDLVSSRQLEVRNVFLRTWDDGVVVKAIKGGYVDDIRVRDSVIANDLGCGALEIGKEAQTHSIGNIRFENIDIIHSHACAALDIGTGDEANIHDVTFADIRIENYRGTPGWIQKWINLELKPDKWSAGAGPGTMNAITFDNVHFISGEPFPSTIRGFDETHMIRGVTFNNLRKFGEKVSGPGQIDMTIEHATGVVFE